MTSLSPSLIINLLAASSLVLVTACKQEQFAAAPPPPYIAPAVSGVSTPPPAKEFKAYFGLNKASLSADTRKAIDAAEAELRANPSVRVRLVGKADSSGQDKRNMALSQRRTEAVYNALVADGISPSRIDRQSVGESQLEVSTANGVRESRNRVVDIFVGI